MVFNRKGGLVAGRVHHGAPPRSPEHPLYPLTRLPAYLSVHAFIGNSVLRVPSPPSMEASSPSALFR